MKQILLSTFIVLSALGQDRMPDTRADQTCVGPLYERKEVSRPAQFRTPDVAMTTEALARGQKAQVQLSAVLCRTGRVTSIVVTKGSPDGMTETVVEAVRSMKFTPAEIDGREVSQAVRFDFRFGFLGERQPLAQGPLEGRRINSVEVGGYREEQKDEVDKSMQLLSGQLYNKEQIERVFQMLIESGNFDRKASTLRIETSELGGLGVVFELKQRVKY